MKLPLVLLVSLLLAPPALLAQAPATPGVFERFDRDGDGKVTSAELANPQAFERFDLDRDGVITRAEYDRVVGAAAPAASERGTTPPAPGAGGLATWLRSLDRDGDNRLSREEAGGAAWFDRIDQNSDGFADAAELARLRDLAGQTGRAGQAGAGRRAPAAPGVTAAEVESLSTGPEILKPGDVGIGRQIPDVAFTDLAGQPRRLSDWKNQAGLVIAVTSATCPVSKRYLPSLAALEADLRAQDIGLVLVNPFASESVDQIRAQLRDHAFAAPYVHDTAQALIAALQARTTTEVFPRRSEPHADLPRRPRRPVRVELQPRRAARAPSAARGRSAAPGKRPDIAATAAPGCELDLGSAPKVAPTPVTYHRDVARILQQNCVSCHHAGGIAPFALDTPAAVKDRARTIRRVVTQGTMPPWFAAPPPEGVASPWANDRSLSARDQADLLAWIATPDRPLGDPADAPAQRTFPTDWTIGTPDLIVPLSRAYDIPATGVMPYQFDVATTTLTEDKWVTAYEILPSARDVVHHVIVNVHERGSAVRDHEEGATGYWAVYVPGNGAHVYQEGFARRLPAGARVSFQIHYTPSGKATQERLRLGLVFAQAPPRYEVKTLPIVDRDLRIPPGAANHVETASLRLPYDVPILSFMAHLHVRGKAFKYELIGAEGATETLLDIPRYDFNWQLRYDLKQPRLIPRGSTVRVTAVFDNSTGNPANPDPTKLVRWGPQTYDEMLIGYLEYFAPAKAAAPAVQ